MRDPSNNSDGASLEFWKAWFAPRVGLLASVFWLLQYGTPDAWPLVAPWCLTVMMRHAGVRLSAGLAMLLAIVVAPARAIAVAVPRETGVRIQRVRDGVRQPAPAVARPSANLPRPQQPEALTMPGDDGFRFHDDACASPG